MEDERKLILKAKEGKEEAFGQLYDKYMPAIYRFVFLKTGGQKGLAEDICHEVFLNAWQKIGNFQFQGYPFSSWLYRIAANAVIDHYRTRKININIDTVPEEAVVENVSLNDKFDDKLDLQTIKVCLKKLEPSYQDVLIMKFVEELSNKEISAALEKSEGAVRVIQHRAIKQLKKYIEDERSNNSTIKEA
ncbi:RNA polymerase sigma factor [bacterium]|nr:MAG: RNA polymerase sigma factor [bacterium]